MKGLIVDDEPSVLEVVQLSIDDLGEFLTAESLVKAERLIEENKDIKIAILDGNTGSGGKLPDTQVLLPMLLAMGVTVIATSSDPELNKILIEKGAHYSVGKPFNVAKLREIISSVQ